MNNKKDITKKPVKKIIKLILKIILILIAIYILTIIVEIASRPIRDSFDKEKYVKLDSQMQILYNDIKSASSSSENWQYNKSCTEQLNGPWPTGQYFCINRIISEQNITTVNEINSLQSKYYPIVNNSNIFNAVTELDPEYPNDFGKKFVVSSIEKNYKEKLSKTTCNYSLSLYQLVRNDETNNELYGSEIAGGVAKASIRIECNNLARGNWYGKND